MPQFSTMFLFLSCVSLTLDEPVDHPFVVYDLRAGEVPLPNDLLVEDGTLSLPTDEDTLSDAEVELREIPDTTTGWSRAASG